MERAIHDVLSVSASFLSYSRHSFRNRSGDYCWLTLTELSTDRRHSIELEKFVQTATISMDITVVEIDYNRCLDNSHNRLLSLPMSRVVNVYDIPIHKE